MNLSPTLKRWGAVALGASAALLVFAQAKLPADLDPQSRARLPYLKKSDADAKAQKVFDTFARDGVLRGPLAFAAYNPGVAQALLDLHNAAVTEGTLDAHTRELAILVACRETNYNLEWNGHSASAAKAGIDEKVIDVVRNGRPLNGLDEKDAAVIRFGRELFHDKKVDSATFAKAIALWGRRGTMDMVAAMSTYAVSGYFAIAVDEQAAEGKSPLPAVK